MKKIIYITLIVSIALCFVSVTVNAAAGGIKWSVTGETLTISGTGDMEDYDGSISDVPWHSYIDEVKEIIITDGVTSIGAYSFAMSSNLEKVTIPDTVTKIGTSAFLESSLKSVTIPKSVTDIGTTAFTALTIKGLTNIEVDKDNPVYSSEDGVLFNKAKTTLLHFPNAKDVAEYSVPYSVKNVEDFAFFNCSNLTKIVMTYGVDVIGYGAFQYCYNLKDITIPHSVKTIEQAAFYGCDNLSYVYYGGDKTAWNKITVAESNLPLASATFHYNTELLPTPVPTVTPVPVKPAQGTCGEGLTWSLDNYGTLTISGTGEMVYDRSSDSWSSRKEDISRVVIANGVTSIADDAFMSCENLTEIVIPDSVTSIGEYAFYGCYNLESIDIPDKVTVINKNTFYRCEKLVIVNIPDGVTSIESGAFDYCINLRSIKIPESVETIGYSAFYCCASLGVVYYGGTEEQWNEIVLDNGNIKLRIAAMRYEKEGDIPPLTYEPSLIWHDQPIGNEFIYEITSVSDITSTSAALRGTCYVINYNYGAGDSYSLVYYRKKGETKWQSSSYGFIYVTTGIYDEITDLEPNTTYEYKVLYDYSSCVKIGEFTTLPEIPGDPDGDGVSNVNDLVYMTEYIGKMASGETLGRYRFPNGTFICGLESARITDDEEINVNDVVLLTEYIGTLASGDTLDSVKFPDGKLPRISE